MKQRTILNVDDTEVARYTKNRTLRHAGFNVVDAVTGADALAQVEALHPEVVLLDVRLPDMSGIDVCRKIKQRWPSTMVLQTSATFVSASDRTRGLEGGADTYLIQPIDPDELVASVRALLRLHAAEEAARALNASLERRIEERTGELHRSNQRLLEQIAQRERAEAALVQSQKMEAVGQLTGSMAHDFNNILASMVGYVHLASRKNQQAEIGSWLEKALAAAERGKRLTARLLAFARNDDLATGPVDVHALVLGMREWLAQSAGSTVQLSVHAGDGELVANTDANQLELAILNLIINARDALPDGGSIEIRAEPRTLGMADDELAAGAYVVVSVADSGTGMSDEVARQAFQPFFTTKPKGRGTGLGLAQVAHLARLSGGAARLRSDVGSGTTIEVWLAAASGAPRDAAVPAPGSIALAGRGERVLLADDEADIRRTIAAMLTENGYAVASAESGAKAIAMATELRPDVAVLDFAMPGLSGVQVAGQLRASYPGLPVLFVSGHVELDLLELAVPGARLLRKPFRPDDLFASLRQCLDGAPRA